MKLNYRQDEPIVYELPFDDILVSLNQFLGHEISLEFQGPILCIQCGRKTSKSFNQGYCFPCVRGLARCDVCMVKPELCHFDKGTCREADWGLANCMIPHTVYLANSSGLKVGITRSYQQMTRWMDQGAVAAVPIARVPSRLLAGKLEVKLKLTFADKTNWRTMLKGDIPEIDLLAERKSIWKILPKDIQHEKSEEDLVPIHYPVLEYPKKITSLNLDKTSHIKGKLLGMKGQYLILSTGVINIRKYAGYVVRFASSV